MRILPHDQDTGGFFLALIKKNREGFNQIFNGIGGKIEDNELPEKAMVREFQEETGVLITSDKWSVFGEFKTKKYLVYCFKTFSDEIHNIRTMTDEPVNYFTLDELDKIKMMPNLKWLIPLALDKNQKYFSSLFIS